MTDLRELTTPLGLLDDETRERLKAHGGPYHFWTPKHGWGNPIPDPGLERDDMYYQEPAEKSWCSEYVYRVYPHSVTKDSINWDDVADQWVCLARNQNGDVFLYDTVVEARNCKDIVQRKWHPFGNRWQITYADNDLNCLSSLKKGDCHWTESLVFRPGYEPKGDQNDER